MHKARNRIIGIIASLVAMLTVSTSTADAQLATIATVAEGVIEIFSFVKKAFKNSERLEGILEKIGTTQEGLEKIGNLLEYGDNIKDGVKVYDDVRAEIRHMNNELRRAKRLYDKISTDPHMSIYEIESAYWQIDYMLDEVESEWKFLNKIILSSGSSGTLMERLEAFDKELHRMRSNRRNYHKLVSRQVAESYDAAVGAGSQDILDKLAGIDEAQQASANTILPSLSSPRMIDIQERIMDASADRSPADTANIDRARSQLRGAAVGSRSSIFTAVQMIIAILAAIFIVWNYIRFTDAGVPQAKDSYFKIIAGTLFLMLALEGLKILFMNVL